MSGLDRNNGLCNTSGTDFPIAYVIIQIEISLLTCWVRTRMAGNICAKSLVISFFMQCTKSYAISMLRDHYYSIALNCRIMMIPKYALVTTCGMRYWHFHHTHIYIYRWKDGWGRDSECWTRCKGAQYMSVLFYFRVILNKGQGSFSTWCKGVQYMSVILMIGLIT